MRKRLAAAAAVAAAVTTLILPATAQASAPQTTSTPSASTAAVPAQWVYHSGPYPSRSACDNMAWEFYYDQGIRGQCRGPYDYGAYKVFYLYLWM